MAGKKQPTARTVEAMGHAAELYANGRSWGEIASTLTGLNLCRRSTGRAAENMTREHPELWRDSLKAAYAKREEEIEPMVWAAEREALEIQLNHARQKGDKRISQSAAHSVLAHAAKLRNVRTPKKIEGSLSLGEILAQLDPGPEDDSGTAEG